MRKTNTVAVSVALVGVVMTILAWIAAPERIDYEVKVWIFILAIVLVLIALGLPAWAFWFERRKRVALDGLSRQIDWAIHNILNRPRPPTEEMNQFANALNSDYEEWCRQVDSALTNKSFFAHSDLIRFQRLGICGSCADDRQ